MPAMNLSPGSTRIGWIGTGVMGSSMCGHLLAAGFSATVYNRTKAKAEKLLAGGARWAEGPQAVAAAADVVFTMVGYPADVRQVVLGRLVIFHRSSQSNQKKRPRISRIGRR